MDSLTSPLQGNKKAQLCQYLTDESTVSIIMERETRCFRARQGFWYAFDKSDTQDDPKVGDLVNITADIHKGKKGSIVSFTEDNVDAFVRFDGIGSNTYSIPIVHMRIMTPNRRGRSAKKRK